MSGARYTRRTYSSLAERGDWMWGRGYTPASLDGLRGTVTVTNPYVGLPASAFWRSGVAETSPFEPGNLYRRKWQIDESDRIATAGSCFAQHVTERLRTNGYDVLDVEPPPEGLPDNLC